ncbi:hypothetical protein D3C84_988220 [compost metagenome]
MVVQLREELDQQRVDLFWGLFRGGVAHPGEHHLLAQSDQVGVELVIQPANRRRLGGRVGGATDEQAGLANHRAIEKGGDLPVAVTAAVVVQRPGEA